MALLFDLLIICLVAGLIYWILTLFPIPQPFKNVALAIFLLILLIWLIGVFMGQFPAPHPIFR